MFYSESSPNVLTAHVLAEIGQELVEVVLKVGGYEIDPAVEGEEV